MNSLFDSPSLLLFVAHLLWLSLFALGVMQSGSYLFNLPQNGKSAALSLALFLPCLCFTIQSTAVLVTGRIMPNWIFWFFPILGAGWLARCVITHPWRDLFHGVHRNPTVIGVFLVLAWLTWSTPFGEMFNGHHHYIMGLASALEHDPTFPLIPAQDLNYDNNVAIWPPLFSFTCGALALPEKFGGLRPFFLFPAFCFLAFTGLILSQRNKPTFERWAPLLTIGGSYYIISSFTDITYDVFTPVWQLFLIQFLLHRPDVSLDRWPRSLIEVLVIFWVVVVAFTVRPHALIVTGVFVVFVLVVKWLTGERLFLTLPTASTRSSRDWLRYGALGFLIVGALSWDVVRYRVYKNPIEPHGLPSFLTGKPSVAAHAYVEQNSPSVESSERLSYFSKYFLSAPVPPSQVSWIKSFFVGLAFPAWTLIAFLLSGVVSRRVRPFLLAWGAAMVAGYILKGDYPKLSGFLAVPLVTSLFWAPDSSVDRYWKWVRPGTMGVTALGLLMSVGLFFYNQSGHRPKTEAWTVARCFLPGACTPLERLNHRTGGNFTQADIQLYETLAQKPTSVLLADHEPGALIPSLAGMKIWETWWYSSPRLKELWEVQTKESGLEVLNRYGIQWIQLPGRDHGQLEQTFFMKLLRSLPPRQGNILSVQDLSTSA